MLVMKRRRRERLFMTDGRTGETLGTMTLLDIEGGSVRIGFDLPPHVDVVREEAKNQTTRTRPVEA